MRVNSDKHDEIVEEIVVDSAAKEFDMTGETASRYEELKSLANEYSTRLIEVLSERRKIELAFGTGAKKADAQFLSLFYGPTVGNFVISAGEGVDNSIKDTISRIFFASNRLEGFGSTHYYKNKRFKPSVS